jgi:hypothetical protein
MSDLTKKTARKTTKKPANRPAQIGGIARRQSSASNARKPKKASNRLAVTTRHGNESRPPLAKNRQKRAGVSPRKSGSTGPSKKSSTRKAIVGSSRLSRRTLEGRKEALRKKRSAVASHGNPKRPTSRLSPTSRTKTTGISATRAGRDRAATRKLKDAALKNRLLHRKEKEKLKKQRERERERISKLRDQQKLRKKRAAERSRRQLELERAHRQREKEALRVARAREGRQREKNEERRRRQQEKEAKRLTEIRAREENRRRSQLLRDEAKQAKEDERQRQKAEREAERELARRQKEEERAKREAERDAYRKAKESERERLRATREAQKRALEGRIAEATRNANKLGGGRSATTRIYSPRAIPNQSGTTRRVLETSSSVAGPTASGGQQLGEVPMHDQGAGTTSPGISNIGDEPPRVPSPPERPLPTAESVEDRFRIIEERLKEAPAEFRHGYQEALDMSWIYHDSALEGVVYTFQELRAAIDQSTSSIADSSLQPVVEEVRRHKAAIELVRELGEKKRAPITVDVIRRIYLTLHPEEGDIKTVKYRRDIPQHRLYFHEYAHPEKIQHKVRQIVDWLNGPEPKKLKSPIRVASRAHYELLRVFPFQNDSGKVARLFMNLLLLRAGHPPAIVHSTERQRYYEALRGALPTLIQMVTESILNGLVSIEKLLDDQEAKSRANAT